RRGWGRDVRKAERSKRRDLSGVRAPGRSQSPHSTAAAMSREKHGKQSRAEGRWAGRWMREGQDRSTDSTGSARKGYTRCRKPEATTLVVGRSFGVDGAHGIGVGNGVKEQERPRHRSTRATARLRTNQAARFTARVVARYSR